MSNNCFLVPGGKLLPGDSLVSPNGQYTFTLTPEGQITLIGPGVNWSRGTKGEEVGCLVMQSDGNLVLYDSNNHDLWASGTENHASFLVIQDDGNAVIYQLGNIWATDTSQQVNSC
jgi:hypothetical protein